MCVMTNPQTLKSDRTSSPTSFWGFSLFNEKQKQTQKQKEEKHCFRTKAVKCSTRTTIYQILRKIPSLKPCVCPCTPAALSNCHATGENSQGACDLQGPNRLPNLTKKQKRVTVRK